MATGSGVGTPATTTNKRYATVADLKTWLGITDTTDDGVLQDVLDEACSAIDADCNRYFYQSDAGTVRYYTATRPDRVLIDDCVSLTAVETDEDGDRTYETSWAATDYDLCPDNASSDDEPYTEIRITPEGEYDFPTGVRKGVKLTGTWGWPKVPDAIGRAAIIKAAWLFKRRETPLGIAGTADLGMVRVGRWDSDYERLIAPFQRIVVA